MPKIQIVDEHDNVIGAEDKKAAHAKGLAHRIVRIFLFNPAGQLYMQKRAPNLKDAPDLWDQSVGGHVDEGEDYMTAAIRETEEEIGLTGLELQPVAKFYSEYSKMGRRPRFNMVYRAVSSEEPRPNPEEASGGRWISLSELERMMRKNPEQFTAGFIKSYEVYKEQI